MSWSIRSPGMIVYNVVQGSRVRCKGATTILSGPSDVRTGMYGRVIYRTVERLLTVRRCTGKRSAPHVQYIMSKANSSPGISSTTLGVRSVLLNRARPAPASKENPAKRHTPFQGHES